jgi:outer membrane protein OmpA-like peptidoglycan-associated protein
MVRVKSGQLIIGASLVAIGYVLLVAAMVEQAQRAAAAAAIEGSAFEATAAARTATSPTPAYPPPAATPAPLASTTPAATTAPTGSTASADQGGETQDVKLFKFSPGGAAMSRDEVQRLIAFGKVLAKHPAAKVSIEGFGDRPGSEALMVGIAKHRAKVAQMLLAKSGVTDDRVTLSFVDMGADPHLAQMIRITTLPPLSELEKP